MGQRDRVRNNGTGTKTDKNNDNERERERQTMRRTEGWRKKRGIRSSTKAQSKR